MSATKDDTAGILEWKVEQSDDWTNALTFTISGVAVNLTGYTWLCEVRREKKGPVIASSAAPLSNITIDTSQAASGIITVTVLEATTATIPAGMRYWRMKRTNSGSKRTYVKGPLQVVDEDG